MATIRRGPLIYAPARKRSADVAQQHNRLLTTLAIVTIAKASIVAPVERREAPQPEVTGSFRALLEASPTPFSQVEWQNPVERTPRDQPDPGGNLYGKTLTVIDLDGGRPDWSAPTADDFMFRERHPEQQRNAAALADVVVVEPFQQSDWPESPRKRELRPQLLWRMVSDSPEPLPFAQLEWGVTEVRRFEQPELTPYPDVLVVPDALPFSSDFFDPVPRPERLEAHALATIIYEPAVPDPFRLTDWPGRVSKKPVDVGQLPSALTGPLNTAQTLPFALTEWPIVRKVARFQETPQPNLQSTLYVIPATPFSQTDWPTAELRFAREDHNRANLMGTLPPPEIPFALDDWPNPLRKQDPHFDVWGQSLQHTTLFVENVKPFNQSDWNVGFLFDPRETYHFISYQPKVIIEGGGLPGLQPPTYVVGTMHVTFGVASPMSAIGRSVDGEMQVTFAVDGSIDTSEEFEGPV